MMITASAAKYWITAKMPTGNTAVSTPARRSTAAMIKYAVRIFFLLLFQVSISSCT